MLGTLDALPGCNPGSFATDKIPAGCGLPIPKFSSSITYEARSEASRVGGSLAAPGVGAGPRRRSSGFEL